MFFRFECFPYYINWPLEGTWILDWFCTLLGQKHFYLGNFVPICLPWPCTLSLSDAFLSPKDSTLGARNTPLLCISMQDLMTLLWSVSPSFHSRKILFSTVQARGGVRCRERRAAHCVCVHLFIFFNFFHALVSIIFLKL